MGIMQSIAEPPGRDIGAENLNARVEEKELEPKPFICEIYRRDFLSFLTYKELQMVRMVSAGYDHTVKSVPHLLPARPKLDRISIFGVNLMDAAPAIYDESGFVKARVRGEDWIPWQDFPEFRNCCREVKERANEIMAQGEKRLLLNRPPLDMAYFWLNTVRNSNVVLAIRNEMTPATASAVLHFIEHLRDYYIDMVSLNVDLGLVVEDDELHETGFLNQTLVRLLTTVADGSGLVPKKIYARHAEAYFNRVRLEMTPLAASTLLPLACIEMLKSTIAGARIDQTLHLIASGRRYAPKMDCSVEGERDEDFIGGIIRFYQRMDGGLRNAIPSVLFTFPNDQLVEEWPEECPMQEAELRRAARLEYFVFTFVNQATSERFRVSLRSPVPRLGEEGDARKINSVYIQVLRNDPLLM